MEPIPALSPSPGQSPNFIHPVSIQRWEIVCSTLCLSITFVTFALRTYVRIRIMKQWILEDCVLFRHQSSLTYQLMLYRYVLRLIREIVPPYCQLAFPHMTPGGTDSVLRFNDNDIQSAWWCSPMGLDATRSVQGSLRALSVFGSCLHVS